MAGLIRYFFRDLGRTLRSMLPCLCDQRPPDRHGLRDVAAMNDFHEVWWIYSPSKEEWGGLHIAHFRKTSNGDTLIVTITGDERRRLGVRIWSQIEGPEAEGWFKVSQIEIPTAEQIRAAPCFPKKLSLGE